MPKVTQLATGKDPMWVLPWHATANPGLEPSPQRALAVLDGDSAHKKIRWSQAVVAAHTFNPNTQKTEAGGSLRLRPA